MRTATRTLLTLLACCLLPGVSLADKCKPRSQAAAASRDGRFSLEARFDPQSNAWKVRLEDRQTKRTTDGGFEGLGWHTHLSAFVADDGSRVVVFDATAGRAQTKRLLIYDASLKLLKAFTLEDLLTPAELDKVRYSVSHCHFVEPDPETKSAAWLGAGGKTFAIRVEGGRTIRVALDEPKILLVARA
jgi:hypothetical protein